MAAHSRLGASSASRWFACPGSVKLSGRVTETAPVSVYAAEGTAAHALAEICLRGKHEADEMIGRTVEGFEVDEGMAEAVQVYLDTVRDLLFMGGDSDLSIETRINLTHLHPDLWGTLDTSLYTADGALYVIDYKHGQGVAVEASDNKQLKYYALGALRNVPSIKAVKKIVLLVVQPRAPHRDGPVRSYELTYEALVAFGKDLVEAARATEAPDAPLVPGDQCRFCPAAAICPALRSQSIAVAQEEFVDTPIEMLTPDEVASILVRIDLIDGWIKSVEAHALGLARAGVAIPGYKLVDKRPVRKWREPDGDVSKMLQALGIDEDDVWVWKIVTPPAAEKLLPKAKRDLLKPMIAAVSSGTTLVPESDKRPPVIGGGTEFTAVEDAGGSDLFIFPANR